MCLCLWRVVTHGQSPCSLQVFLESLLLEVRAGNLQAATEQAERALAVHSGTGRLWAMLIQLKQSEGEQIQLEMFHAALREVCCVCCCGRVTCVPVGTWF